MRQYTPAPISREDVLAIIRASLPEGAPFPRRVETVILPSSVTAVTLESVERSVHGGGLTQAEAVLAAARAWVLDWDKRKVDGCVASARKKILS